MKKLGTNAQNAPAERPNKNLPTKTAHLLAISVRPQPIERRMLFARMHLLFPYFIKGPEDRDPIA